MPDQPERLTDAELSELERLEREATAGPWTVELRPSHRDYCTVSAETWPVCTIHYDDDRRPIESECATAKHSEEDALLIAVLRNSASKLLSAARRERESRELLRGLLQSRDIQYTSIPPELWERVTAWVQEDRYLSGSAR